MDVEIDADTDGHDENNGWSGAEFDTQKAQNTEELNNDGSQNEGAESGRPNAHEGHAEDEEDGHQDAGQRQEQEEAQFQVLLPESERNSGRKVGQAAVFEFLADTSHL